MKGYIQIHRQILEWEWFDDHNTFRLFMYLLLKANHKQRKYKGTTIRAGELITGLSVLSQQTGLSVQQIRTSIKRLKSTNEITSTSSSKGTKIQVVNYCKYQLLTSELTVKQQTNNKQIAANNNVNNVNNVNKDLVPSVEEYLKHALKRKPNVCPEDVKLRYYSWVDNDWSINRNGINTPIKNWKSTLTNTLKYLNERYTKPIEPIKESLEDRVKRLNLEHKQKG
jgi:hypothetical protein